MRAEIFWEIIKTLVYFTIGFMFGKVSRKGEDNGEV